MTGHAGHLLQFFAYEHLPPALREVSAPFGILAASMCRLPVSIPVPHSWGRYRNNILPEYLHPPPLQAQAIAPEGGGGRTQ